jgi:transposase
VNRAALLSLSCDDLIAVIEAQAEQIISLMAAQARQIAALTGRIAELQAKLANPAKIPGNSSVPPSTGQKPNLPEPGGTTPRPSRPGVARALAEHPDVTIEATLAACPHCDHALDPADMTDIHAYDHIDLPPIRPIITRINRINRHRGVCPCCRKPVSAPAPEGLAPGSPFGPGVAALNIHLQITQAVSFERLARLMDEVFGLSISGGSIANILARAQAPVVGAVEAIAATVRTSPVVGSDETSARVRGKTWWQWVLLSATAICHVIADTRAAAARRDVPYTNNACERALRPSVIFRKVTNCFRAEWRAKVYVAAASVIATGRLQAKPPWRRYERSSRLCQLCAQGEACARGAQLPRRSQSPIHIFVLDLISPPF